MAKIRETQKTCIIQGLGMVRVFEYEIDSCTRMSTKEWGCVIFLLARVMCCDNQNQIDLFLRAVDNKLMLLEEELLLVSTSLALSYVLSSRFSVEDSKWIRNEQPENKTDYLSSSGFVEKTFDGSVCIHDFHIPISACLLTQIKTIMIYENVGGFALIEFSWVPLFAYSNV